MKLIVERENLLRPLQAVQGVVERRQTLPILANVLMSCQDDVLSVTATDMEVELVAKLAVNNSEPGEATVPARKLVDICRALPPAAKIELTLDNDRILVRSGRSRFTLSTLPVGDFPSADALEADTTIDPLEASKTIEALDAAETSEARKAAKTIEALEEPPKTIELSQSAVKQMLDLTQFAMAHQDVRYYLNGLLMEVTPKQLRAVATDGHRLALAELDLEKEGAADDKPRQIIVPRKAIGELNRLLGNVEGPMTLTTGTNAVQINLPDTRLISKLIDGRFPDYERVVPQREQCDKQLKVDRETLRQSLTRASILSNEKHRAIRFDLAAGRLRIVANNPEQEEAEDEIEIDYTGEALEIGFNVSYLIDALTAIPTEGVNIFLSDANNSCLIEPEGRGDCRYVVMPMRL